MTVWSYVFLKNNGTHKYWHILLENVIFIVYFEFFFSQIFMIFVLQIFKMEEMLHVLIYNIAEEVEEISSTYMKYKWLTCVHGRTEILNVKITIFFVNLAEHGLHVIHFFKPRSRQSLFHIKWHKLHTRFHKEVKIIYSKKKSLRCSIYQPYMTLPVLILAASRMSWSTC